MSSVWCLTIFFIFQVYNFDRARVEVEQLNTISKDELIEFYKVSVSQTTSRKT